LLCRVLYLGVMRYRELRLSVKICVGSWGNSWLRMSSV
jgi:hypothetical protein